MPVSELRTVVTTREVPTLLSASMIGRLPTAMATIGVLLLVRGEGGDYTLAGALTALFTIGTAIGQPTLARSVDRRGQTGILAVAAGVSTVAFIALALAGAHHVAVSALAALFAGLATPPLEPCLRALWPHVVAGGSTLSAALSLDVGLQEVIFVAGPLLGVGGVALGGHRGGVLGCALFGLVGTVGFAFTHASRRWQPTATAAQRGDSPLRHSVLVRILVVALAAGVPVGALAIVAAAYAAQHGNASLTGWALATNAAGALVSGVYGAIRPISRTSAAALTLAGLALAVGYLPLAIPLPPAGWLPLAALAGLALPVVLSLVFQRIQAHCPPHLLTEANAWVVTAFGSGAATAALVAGIVTDHVGHSAAVPVLVLSSSAVTVVDCALGFQRDRPDAEGVQYFA
jgi:MFS family permease